MSRMSALSSLLVLAVLALCFSFASVRGVEVDMAMDVSNCTDFTNCRDCAAQTNCGWCPAFGLCLEGTSRNVSTDGTCNVTTGGWHFNASDCRNCSSFTNCKSCVEAYSSDTGSVCGWCNSFGSGNKTTNATCWEGTVAGPFFKSLVSNETCAHKSWGLSSGFCGDDEEKRKLAIIIGLSVAGGLFVLAVVATIIFVIVKRMQRSRGYHAINETA